MEETLKNVMKDLFVESNKDIFSQLSEKELEKYISFTHIPEFNSEKIYNKFKKEKIINFKKIIYDYEEKIIGLSSYKTSTNNIKTTIQENPAYIKRLVLDLNHVVKQTLLDFLISCLYESNFKDYDVETFEIIYSKFENFLDNELFSVFSFITLRNFDHHNDSLMLPNDQILRLRTPEEFSVICNVGGNDSEPKINPNFQNIKFVIGAHIAKTDINDQKIKEKFEAFLFALKIFHAGDVQFGGIYYTDSVNWRVKPTITIKTEPILGKSSTKYKLESENLTESDFSKFIKDFSEINFTKGKYVFLGRSIKRFSQAIENEHKLDKIVDFITCLESLYSSNEQQLSFRFAMRTASVLGQTPDQKIAIQEFILQIYNLRSKIIHGDQIPPVIINGHEIDLDSCLINLEKISRNSIKSFLDFIKEFKSKEELHKMIDNSIYELSSQEIFLKSFKELKLSTVNIS